MPRGGARPGAGRKPGGIKQITREAIAKSRAGLSPLDYLLEVIRDENEDNARRLDAARAAAPYCHARLQPTDPGDDTPPVTKPRVLVWRPAT